MSSRCREHPIESPMGRPNNGLPNELLKTNKTLLVLSQRFQLSQELFLLLCVIFGLHTTHRNNTKDISDQGEPWCKHGSGGADGQGSKPSHLGDQQCKASSSSSPSSPSSIQSSPSRHLCAQHGWVASPLCKNVSNVEQSWPRTII